MKKLIFLFSAIALVWGCSKIDTNIPKMEEETVEGTVPDQEITDSLPSTDYVLPEILYAYVSDEDEQNGDGKPQTRTYVENNTNVLWQNGDAVSFFAGNTHNAKYTYTGEDGLASVEFVKDEDTQGTTENPLLKSQAVYPYNKNISVAYDEEYQTDKINLTYPTTQIYAPNSFGKDANIMVATGSHNTDENLYFRNACGYLVIKLYGIGTNGNPTSIKSITLSSVSGVDKIAGSAVIIPSNDAAPIINMSNDASTAVTLDCSNGGAGVALGTDAENATTFWFCLPPVTFTGGIKISVTDVYDNTYIKQTTKTINIIRNEVQPMAALQFVSNAPAATKLWYTRSDSSNEILKFNDNEANPFNAPISSHKWDSTLGKFVIEFAGPLTTIKKEAFINTKLATITLSEGVTTIEEGAFRNTPLTEITIPGSVNNIGVDVFYDCEQLSSVTFLPSPTKTALNIGYTTYGSADHSPFYYTKLSSINLNRELILVDDDGTKYIADDWDEGMFAHKNYDEVSSVSVTLGSQVETLSNFMFSYLPIKTLTIPGTVKTIGNNVFDECTALTSLRYEPSPTGEALTHGFNDDSDDDGPFYAATNLSSVYLDREINYTFTSAGNEWEGLFGNKPSLTSVTLGNQVKTISKYMFAKAGIETLVIPGSVNTIQDDAFYLCSKLATLTFEPSPTGTALTMGYDTDDEDENLFEDQNTLTTLNLDREIIYTHTGVDTPSEGAFGGLTKLTNVTLGTQVKTLLPYMFAGSGITSIDLNEVVTIGNHAFINTGITELTIPGSVTTIGNNVFDGCSRLASLTFEPSPSSATLTIGFNDDSDDDGLFIDCPLETLDLNRDINYTFANPANSNEGLFGNKSTLTSITLGDQLTTISRHMFAGAGISELTIPGSVNTIANDVFYNCSKLASITFEPSPTETPLTMGYDTYNEAENLFEDQNTLTTLNLDREIIYTFAEKDIDTYSEGLFGGMSTLTSVTLGDQVKTLHKYMFAGSGITSLNLNKVETINDFALAGVGFTELTIPGTLTTIGNNVFDGCEALTSLTFDPSPTNEALTLGYHVGSGMLDDGPFYDLALTELTLNRQINYPFKGTVPGLTRQGAFASNSGSLKEITLGDQVTNLTAYMFGGAGISSINLNKVRTIEQGAFCNTSIESITIPSTVESVGLNAFWGCEKLTTVNIQDGTDPLSFGAQFYQYVYGPFYDSPLTNIHLGREITYTGYASPILSPTSWDAGFFATEEAVDKVTVTISNNVKTISNYMFAHLNLHSITIPASVTSIGENAFIDCDALTSATISSSTLGSNMFDDCDNLATVTIDGTLDAINMDSFTGCSKLSTLNISGSLGSIGDGTFDGFNLTSLNISGHVGTIGARAFDDNDKMTSFTVTGSVGTIGQYAFNDCDRLATVNVIGTVGTVSSHAFSDCDAVTTLAIPATTVEAYAYEDMDGLLSATLYGTTVGSHVFYDCNSLQTLVIDGGVTSIGNNAFDQCNSLSSVTFESGSEDLHIGFQDETFDKGTFYDSRLTYISLDRELIYDYDDLDTWDEGIFASQYYNDDKLVVTVTLGSNVKTILPWMFSGVRMETVEIPTSVTYIGKRAFSYCYILKEVSCRNTTPPTLGEDVFLNDKDEHNNNLLIKIPYNNNISNEYRSKWSQYAHCLFPTFDN